MDRDEEFRKDLLACIPSLRAFAHSRVRDWDFADDLVQDTLIRAWAKRDRFEPGTNLGAWLFTILRNARFSEHRKRIREVEDPNGTYALRLQTHPDQQSHLDFRDLEAALHRLHPDQRDALLLVTAQGMSYEEAGQVMGVATGTVKSRVNRARTQLADLLSVENEEDIGPDQFTKAAMQG